MILPSFGIHSILPHRNLLSNSRRDGDARKVPEKTGGLTRLEAPQPNPTDGSFLIGFELARTDWVELGVYDVSGRRVAILQKGLMPAGRHSLSWDPAGDGATTRVSPGLYFLRLVTTGQVQAAKLMVLK
jgi:hypothetical protein